MRVWMMAEEDLPAGIHPYSPDIQDVVDVVVCMGGDGTVLFTSSLFQNAGWWATTVTRYCVQPRRTRTLLSSLLCRVPWLGRSYRAFVSVAIPIRRLDCARVT